MKDRVREMWQWEVRRLLVEGLGVEDIARELGRKADDIRYEVTALRDSGELSRMFGGASV